MGQPDQPTPSEKSASLEQENEESSNSSSDGESLTSDKQVPSSSNSPDLLTEGDTDNSNSAKTTEEPGEHD